MPAPVVLLLLDGEVLAATAAEKRLMDLRHVLEEPLDVGPLTWK